MFLVHFTLPAFNLIASIDKTKEKKITRFRQCLDFHY